MERTFYLLTKSYSTGRVVRFCYRRRLTWTFLLVLLIIVRRKTSKTSFAFFPQEGADCNRNYVILLHKYHHLISLVMKRNLMNELRYFLSCHAQNVSIVL